MIFLSASATIFLATLSWHLLKQRAPGLLRYWPKIALHFDKHTHQE